MFLNLYSCVQSKQKLLKPTCKPANIIISHMQAIKQFQQVQTTINTSKHPFKSDTKDEMWKPDLLRIRQIDLTHQDSLIWFHYSSNNAEVYRRKLLEHWISSCAHSFNFQTKTSSYILKSFLHHYIHTKIRYKTIIIDI